ncbi:putative ergosterol biosynthetic protein 28 [Apostichopus japonicus]|uniref:Putative ergosterol biosynthetic protein 28 n=1 Tax=Stichopus japonicus TaxID=307972 RepID=A0A2G8JJV0_STIJA|nr:putative ergosterol biosynthetic protein 28 [Apostichopus japonicus]
MKKFERVLRTWLTLIAFMSLASSVQCFVESTLIIQTMYSQPTDQVNALIGRMFGTWTMLSGVVRLMCAVFIDNRPVYDLTLFTFIMVWLHFLSELLIFKTTEPSFGVVSPMVISGISMVLMIAGYKFIFNQTEDTVEERRPANQDTKKAK